MVSGSDTWKDVALKTGFQKTDEKLSGCVKMLFR